MIPTQAIQNILGRAFPWMAISGLLLAGWGLIITPDEIKHDTQWARYGAGAASTVLANGDSVEVMAP